MVGTPRCGVCRTARRTVPTLAFTLIELLVVISILGLLAALAVPAIKNLGKSNINISASRQLLDDVGRARQLAMSQRTTVYMVFVPTNFWLPPYTSSTIWTNGLTLTDRTNAANLADKQLTGYTFVAQGMVGDQPGQRKNHWLYLSSWVSLPDGTFIASQKFIPPSQFFYISAFNPSMQIYGFATNQPIPFPTETNSPILLPYIAFNYLGQLTDDGVNMANAPEYIPLARGSVSFGHDQNKAPQLSTVLDSDIVENPPGNSTNSAYNLVEIDPLTGRATLKFQKVQ
jgi:prepilin-type N-terminal cleavage/methylation domain-containing protein